MSACVKIRVVRANAHREGGARVLEEWKSGQFAGSWVDDDTVRLALYMFYAGYKKTTGGGNNAVFFS